MRELTRGLWRWTARHPEWHPGEFGREVGSYAVRAGDDTVLVDPLLPPEPGAVLSVLDDLLGERLAIVVTIPYHVRSAEPLWRRYRERVETTIHGHRALAKRLEDTSGFRAAEPGSDAPGGATFHAIGKPRRYEMPVYLGSHRALAFGDAVVEAGGELRMWSHEKVDARKARWYAERFAPSARPLLELAAERILVTHGEPVLNHGTAALATALDGAPWHHRA
jgi:hypothetical protein